MKKFEVRSLLALLLATMLVFALVACGGADDTLPPDSGTDPAVTEPTETDPIETDPPATEPVETDPPATEPVETDPPATEPVETEPSETEPAETDAPETTPVSTECEHKYADSKRIAATCQREGGIQYTCQKCGETKMENVTPKIDHVYGTSVLVTPSCSSEGQAVDRCEFCGDSKEPYTLPTTDHRMVTNKVNSPSYTHCNANVTACALCGMVESAAPCDAHSFGAPIIVADEGSEGVYINYGYEIYVCGTCGYQHKISSNHAAGHYYELRTEDGKYECKCGSVVGDFVNNGNKNAGPILGIN